MARKREKGCMTVAVVLIAVVFTVVAAGWYIKKEYKSKQAAIKQAISELPRFDKVAVAKEIAKGRGFAYPVSEVTMTPSEIVKSAKEKAEELTSQKFPFSLFAKRQTAALKKYRVAKNGDNISFIMRTTGETVSGVLKGVFKDSKGRFVKVDFHEYRLPDIMDDYYYLFVPAIATQKAEKVLKELTKGFKEHKRKFMQKTEVAIRERLYKQSGYTKDGSKWISNREFIKSAVADREEDYKKTFKREKEKIYERNKLFGLIGVDLIPEVTDKNR